jgi:hypothetical protein
VRGDPQDKLRELVLLYSQRDKVLTTAEEDSIVNTAVSEYGFTVGAARAIVIATAAGAGIEVEGDYEDAAKAMLVALGGTRKSITEADFALIVQYYLGKSKLPQDEVRRRVKQLIEKAGISPAPRGIFFSTRWFRTIR